MMALKSISIVILSAFVLQSVTFIIRQENYLHVSNTQQTEYAHSPFLLVAAAAKGNVKNDRQETAEEFREILQLPQRRRHAPPMSGRGGQQRYLRRQGALL